MKIGEIRDGDRKIDLTATVIEKGETREAKSRYTDDSFKVATATIEDETGTIALNLWNEQIDTVNIGNKVHIINGWVSEWQGEKQLSTGKFGQLEIVGEGSEGVDEAEEAEILNKKEISTDEGENILTEDEKLEEDVVKDEEEIK